MFSLIHVSESLEIPTYYLIISLVIVFCLFWIFIRTKNKKLSRELSLDLSLIIMISGFIGARLLHVGYENLDYYLHDPIKILFFWDGGFVFFGGAILAAAFSLIFLKLKSPRLTTTYLDLFAPVLSFSYSAGRLACLMAGCCYGRYCNLPWSVAGRHPTQIYASLWELGVLCILLRIDSIPPKERRLVFLKRTGVVFYLWMVLHSSGRLVMESFRDDFRGPSWGLSISSWMSLLLIFIGLILIYKAQETKPKVSAS